MANQSRRHFLQSIAPATLATAAILANIKKAVAQSVPIVATRKRKSILIASSMIYRSRDGFGFQGTALPQISTNEVVWADMAWNGTVYCAVGDGSAIATSTNLTTWTSNLSPFQNGHTRILTKGTTFYLLPSGDTNKLATSTNGSTWSTLTLPISDTWCDLIWTGSLFCLVSAGTSSALTSPDGVTWTQRTLPASGQHARVVWNGSVFCIANYDGSVFTSPDGITWTTRTGVPADPYLIDACCDAGKIYLVSNQTCQVYVSSDGGVSFSAFGTAPPWFGTMGFVVIGTNIVQIMLGGSMYVSTNSGATWSSSVPMVGPGPYTAVRYLNSYYMTFGLQFGGGTYNGLSTSTNVTTWTSRGMPYAFKNVYFSSISATGSKMCAVTNTTTASCLYSNDYGTTWSTGTLPTSAKWGAISTNGTIFCVLGNTALSSGYTSADGGATWTARSLPFTRGWTDLCWNGSLFCAVAGSGSYNTLMTSPDGITWTSRTLPSARNWVRVIWNGSQFLALTSNVAIAATSPDGITWTQRTLSATDNWNGACWTGTHFVVVGSSSSVITSPDGITWTTRTTLPLSPTFLTWNGVALIAIAFNQTAISHDLGTTWTKTDRTVSLGSGGTGTGLILVDN